MPTPNPAALEFLLTRRSRPAKTLAAPGPDAETLTRLLTAAARTPDHGKLEPWRFIVLQGAALTRLGDLAQQIGTAQGLDPEKVEKGRQQFVQSHCCVAVIAAPKASDKIPEIEQTYSAGAVCLALLNAALADGWGANWLSGSVSHDAAFRDQALGLAPNERVAGFIHLGTETTTPPDRPRPDLEKLVHWVSK